MSIAKCTRLLFIAHLYATHSVQTIVAEEADGRGGYTEAEDFQMNDLYNSWKVGYRCRVGRNGLKVLSI